MPAKILTVLREGGEYRAEHVERLRRQCQTFAPGIEFMCLNGGPQDDGWPGWWAKVSAFRLPGPILYMDLDTHVVGDLTPPLRAVERYRFIALRNPLSTPSRFGSGLMGWSDDMTHVQRRFAAAPEHHMRRCTTQRLWGDQGFIAEDEPEPALWQDILPNQIVSWKVDCKAGIPKDARVVYFHGKPRPWDVGL